MGIAFAPAPHRWVILALAFVSQWSIYVAAQAIAPLAPLFQPELGLNKAEIGMFASAVFAGAWVMMLAGGYLTDRFGAGAVACFGQVVTGVFLLSMAAVGAYYQALLVMFAAGMGRGMVAPAVPKAISDWFPPGNRATAMGVKQAGTPVAGITTASILPSLGVALGWRVAIAASGVVVIASGIAMGILYRNPSHPWGSSGRAVRGGAGLAELVRDWYLWALSIVALLLAMSQFAATTYLALYFKDVVLVAEMPDERARVVVAGGYLALSNLGGVVGRLVWGVVSDHLFHGRRMGALAIIAVCGSALSVAMAQLQPGLPAWLLVTLVFVHGATATAWGGLYMALVVEAGGRKHAGTAAGLSMSIAQFGMVAGPPLFGLVVDAAASYQPAWYLAAGLLALAGLTASLLVGPEMQSASASAS